MIERELTKDLNGVGRIIPTKLGISRPTLTIITRGGEYGVRDVRKTTGHFREPGSLSSEYHLHNGSLL